MNSQGCQPLEAGVCRAPGGADEVGEGVPCPGGAMRSGGCPARRGLQGLTPLVVPHKSAGADFCLRGRNYPRPRRGRTFVAGRSKPFARPARSWGARHNRPGWRSDGPSPPAAAAFFGGFFWWTATHTAFHSDGSKMASQSRSGHSRPRRHTNNVRQATIKYIARHGNTRSTCPQNAAVRCGSPTSACGTTSRCSTARSSTPRSSAPARACRSVASSTASIPPAAPPPAGSVPGPAPRSPSPAAVGGPDARAAATSPSRPALRPWPAASRGSDGGTILRRRLGLPPPDQQFHLGTAPAPPSTWSRRCCPRCPSKARSWQARISQCTGCSPRGSANNS